MLNLVVIKYFLKSLHFKIHEIYHLNKEIYSLNNLIYPLNLNYFKKIIQLNTL